MRRPPVGLVAVDVTADLRRPGTEPHGVRRQLRDLPGHRVQAEADPGESRPELGVGGHGCVADAVQRLDRVPEPDRVQTTPLPGGEHPGVELQMQVSVRVAGTRRVVPDSDRLDSLDRDLHLAAAWPDPGGRVLGQPGDDLLGGSVLSRLVRRGDVWVQRRGE